jgi:hypothetical protein
MVVLKVHDRSRGHKGRILGRDRIEFRRESKTITMDSMTIGDQEVELGEDFVDGGGRGTNDSTELLGKLM